MVCLPEHFAYMNPDTLQGKEYGFRDINNEIFARYKQLALDHQVWLSLGCFPEHDL